MGLHPDVKKFLRTRFPSSVGDGVPETQCDVLVCDHMWLLFKFHPDEGSTGEDLVDFFWRPMLRFFRAGGTSYVCVFDVPERVPVARPRNTRRGTAADRDQKNPWERARRRRSASVARRARRQRGASGRVRAHRARDRRAVRDTRRRVEG